MNKTVRQIVLPTVAAFIWGSGFIIQKEAANASIGTFTFNALRSAVAFIALLILVLLLKFFKKDNSKVDRKKLYIGGFLCGLCLSVATSFQQFGINYTTAGKAGFITALYIVIVPLLTIFSKSKVSYRVWISVGISIVGLYFLCIDESFTVTVGDILLILCAFVFSLHILTISHFTKFVDGIELSCVQFLTCTVLCSIAAIIFEPIQIPLISEHIGSIIYIGLFSSAVAYTLQIIAEKGTNPTIVSLLLSLESVFSVLLGAILLKEVLTVKEYIGCILMFTAVILAQLPNKKSSNC